MYVNVPAMGRTINNFDICELLDPRFKNKEQLIEAILELKTYLNILIQLDGELPD